VTRRDQPPPRAEAKLLRLTTCRALTPNSKRADQQILHQWAGLPPQHHTADDASAHDKSSTNNSPRCPQPRRDRSKILKTP
jgi:hypothetical protein